MAIAVLVVLGGLVVGVTFELLVTRRRTTRPAGSIELDPETLLPSQPRLPEPRFVEDGEGFTILGPVEYDDAGPAPWESDEPRRTESDD